MKNDKSNQLFTDLDELLETERSALLSGDLEIIVTLLERKETLIEELSVAEEFEANALDVLTGKMKRNQDLLDSALEGIRNVASRLAAMRRVRSTLDTYDSNGSKQSITIAKDSNVEKRA
ncbi:MAG: hypothetical protein ABJC67_13520 [Lentilitoribacter sp.]